MKDQTMKGKLSLKYGFYAYFIIFAITIIVDGIWEVSVCAGQFCQSYCGLCPTEVFDLQFNRYPSRSDHCPDFLLFYIERL
ncbi:MULTISPECIES: hypothetical protein [Aerococcus]|uniref:Uncharacterized protein n=1 Tax=Aerococcus sanguinicola TaxID=119206 RepID=A0A5N1GL98_9LACT|nr:MULTISPECIES: hypothetical protein [Aerococcus]KAA9300821.1 hypothetical protein F6I03_05820 [Aerococcus sanguinicola]MDK6369390.1 hypothetical protein [Aerococcus sp. UMB9870]MDK6679892.1 hypothetical protein [Aerococcus sp. UMB8608]MDK6686747.1 hypothetical protein [Aerococcus sp. UMB8623]MDK6939814.1 hypothetical protein [Aerococcus sp. UMB8487]